MSLSQGGSGEIRTKSWRNLPENSGDRAADGLNWLPGISAYGLNGVVCVAGKNPDDDKILSCCMVAENGIGCPNLVPIAMIAAKPDEVIGKRRHQPNLENIRCRLKI